LRGASLDPLDAAVAQTHAVLALAAATAIGASGVNDVPT